MQDLVEPPVDDLYSLTDPADDLDLAPVIAPANDDEVDQEMSYWKFFPLIPRRN